MGLALCPSCWPSDPQTKNVSGLLWSFQSTTGDHTLRPRWGCTWAAPDYLLRSCPGWVTKVVDAASTAALLDFINKPTGLRRWTWTLLLHLLLRSDSVKVNEQTRNGQGVGRQEQGHPRQRQRRWPNPQVNEQPIKPSPVHRHLALLETLRMPEPCQSNTDCGIGVVLNACIGVKQELGAKWHRQKHTNAHRHM